jgi:predicted RNA-binding Zn-ribbon protein involved in translation (DUF1610 family)
MTKKAAMYTKDYRSGFNKGYLEGTAQTQSVGADRYRLGFENGISTVSSKPIEMLLWCPSCGARHIDEGEFATKPHHTHACQTCGMCWRPAVRYTSGVQFLPGFKNVPSTET